MGYPTKIATCCYCGTRAALVLTGKHRHELSCSGCGAPLVLSRFSSGLFRAMFAMKEIENGKEIDRRVSARCGAHGDDQWPNAASTFIGFGGWAFDA